MQLRWISPALISYANSATIGTQEHSVKIMHFWTVSKFSCKNHYKYEFELKKKIIFCFIVLGLLGRRSSG